MIEPAVGERLREDSKDVLARRGTHWLGVVLALASTAGIVLALLGYGVALAVQGTLGVPYATLLGSPIDLLNLGGWAVAQVILGAGPLLSWSFFPEAWQLLGPTIGKLWRASLLVSVAYVAFFLLRWGSKRTVRSSTAIHARAKLRECLVNKAGFEAFFVGVFVFIFVSLAAPAFVIGGFIALAVLSTAIAIVPIFGLSAGQMHIKDWVVEPTVCVSRQQRIHRLTQPKEQFEGKRARGADCVAVTRSDGHVEKGRLVFATTNSVVLYDPSKVLARRIPTEGAVVESIDAL